MDGPDDPQEKPQNRAMAIYIETLLGPNRELDFRYTRYKNSVCRELRCSLSFSSKDETHHLPTASHSTAIIVRSPS